MDLYKALYAFYQSLLNKECEHQRVQLTQKASYCPDCGYKVKLLWTLVKCRKCDSKRVPKRALDGKILPLHKFCRHCGASEHRLVKKDKIDAYELPYALSVREIDYSEERKSPDKVSPFTSPHPKAMDVVEGQVLRKRYVSQNMSSAWEEPPFNWQKGPSGNYQVPNKKFHQFS